MKVRNVNIAFSMEWKKSKIVNKEQGFYNEYTVSLLQDVPIEVSDKELIERWDSVSLRSVGSLKTTFHWYDLLDEEKTAAEDYRVRCHNELHLN